MSFKSICSGFVKLMHPLPTFAPSSLAPVSTTCFRKPYIET